MMMPWRKVEQQPAQCHVSVEQSPEVETFRYTIGSSPGWQKQKKNRLNNNLWRVWGIGKSRGGNEQEEQYRR